MANPANTGAGLYIEPREITDSWATIAERTKADTAKYYYRIGDYKPITLSTGETVIQELAGTNTYTGYGDTAIGPHTDWISRDCLSGTRVYNTTATNNGTLNSQNPFTASRLCGELNNTVFETLPSDLQSVIVDKMVIAESRYSSSGAASSNTGIAMHNIGQLWLPAEIEVFGHASWSEKGRGTSGFIQYPIFAKYGMGKIIKRKGSGGERCTWWELNAKEASATSFCCVNASGYSGSTEASTTWVSVPLCFRIG